MDSHSRSASPRDAPRPQHRPPSPPASPTSLTPPAGYDNRAYQPDDNHNASFASNGNGHAKEPNGDTKTLEAVNLELINMTPKNGKKKDVEVDMNATNPYDEYFVPVNEHKKYMRGEKLYLTADKRGEKGGCKRPLCWTLLGLVVIAIVALIVLAATGVLFASTPKTLEQYNASLSSARAFGGLLHDHEHDHSDHDHSAHDHDHSAHDHSDHDHENDTNDLPHDGQEATTEMAQNDMGTDHQNEHDHPVMNDESGDMYVPRTLEGELTIDNKDFVPALEDPDSEGYREFAENFKEALKNSLFDRNMLENGSDDVSIEIVQIRNGSVIVTYRVHWKPKRNEGTSEDLLTAETLKANLDNYLEQNSRMISVYHIAEDKTPTKPVIDLCKINNNGCEHICEFDESTLEFICLCPRGQIQDPNSPKLCVPLLEENPTMPEDHDHDHQLHLHESAPKAEPEPEPTSEPNSEPKAEPEPEPVSEPKPETKVEVEPISEPKPEPNPEPEPTSEPEPEPKSEPSPEPTSEPETEPKAEPVPEPEPEPEPKAEPEPEPTSEPEPEPKVEPEPIPEQKIEPEMEPTSEPKSEPEPTAEPEAETQSEPKTSEPKAEPGIETLTQIIKTESEMKSFLETTPEPEPKPETESKIELETKPALEMSPEPTTTSKSSQEPEVILSEQTPMPETILYSLNKPETSSEKQENSSNENMSNQEHSMSEIADKMMEISTIQNTSSESNDSLKFDQNIKLVSDTSKTEENLLPVTVIPTYYTESSSASSKKIVDGTMENPESRSKTIQEPIFNLDHMNSEEYTTMEAIINQNDESSNKNMFSVKEVLPNNEYQSGETKEVVTSQPSEIEHQMATEHSNIKNNSENANIFESPLDQESDENDWLQNDKEIVELPNNEGNKKEDMEMKNMQSSQEKEQRASKSFNSFESEVTTEDAQNNIDDENITLDYVKKIYSSLGHDFNSESNVEKEITGSSLPTNHNAMMTNDENKNMMPIEETENDVTDKNDSTIEDEEPNPTTESSKFKFISTYQPATMSSPKDNTRDETHIDKTDLNPENTTENNMNVADENKMITDEKTSDTQRSADASTEREFNNVNILSDDSSQISSKIFTNIMQNSNFESMKDITETSTDSDWLSQPATEANDNIMINKMESSEVKEEENPVNLQEMMNSEIKNDFEPDYLSNFETKSKELNNQDESISGMTNEYEDNKSKEGILSQKHQEDRSLAHEMKDQNTDSNVEMTTVINYIYRQSEKNKLMENLNHEQGIIYATPVSSTDEIFPNAMYNETQENVNDSNGNTDLRVNVYELSSHNDSQSSGRRVVNHHSTEYEDHETEMNPFLPDIENNKVLVKKLQEGNDIELVNVNETQNENVDDHNAHGVLNTTQSSEANIKYNINSNSQESHSTSDSFNEFSGMQDGGHATQTMNSNASPVSSFEDTTESREYLQYKGSRELPETPTFLLDTDDLDSRTAKSHSSNILNYNDNESLRVVPIEGDESQFSKENLQNNLNDISDSRKKSDRRIDLSQGEFVNSNEA
ncbi:putative uncharacterized protein DDB_G0290989 isoform X2 [Aricia agestis]|uniref:putative uncharacterized protein DDB_G0290989 isoform X2 n=1 Tax=Aricia agestis TaxID=91739 RepID=UPI001C207BA0|nr:putative uncharacterized protein DDB_G0290989 isoform X2 [Aricia agestis]